MRRETALTGILAIGAFTTALNGVMLGPLLKDIGAEFSVSDSVVGQLATAQAVIAALVALLLAPLIDRYPRRNILRGQCAALTVATLLTAVAPSFGWLLVARVAAGIGGAIIFGVSLAVVADMFSDPNVRNRRLGFLLSAASMAFIVGTPVLAQVNDLAGWRWASGSTVILPVIVVAGTWWLPSAAGSAHAGLFMHAYRARIGQVLGSRESLWLLGVLVAVFAVWGGFSVYLAAHLQTTFGAGANAVSVAFLLAGISFTLGSNLMPRILERAPKRAAHSVAGMLIALNLLLVGVVYSSLWTSTLMAIIFSLLMAGLFVVSSILLVDSLPAARGAVMSLQSSSTQLGVAIGAGWGGLALTLFGSYPAVFRSLALLLPVAALLLLMSARAARPATAQLTREEIVAEPAR